MTDRIAISDDEDDPAFGADATGYRAAPRVFSTNAGSASANDPDARRFRLNAGLTRGMDYRPNSFIRQRLPDLVIAIQSIAGFWLLYISLITIRAVVLDYPDFWEMLGRRAISTLVGFALTFLVYLALRPFAAATLAKKATVAGFLCFPGSIAFAAFNYYIFYIYAPLDAASYDPEDYKGMTALEMAVQTILESSLSWYFLFAAWAALYVAMSYAKQLRASDRRAAAFAREAQDSQLRALRYQINPHFLFNTLNSLSSLILSQRTNVAERMIMNLSAFFRATLSADPTADISLAEEIRLQRLYLDIEQVRFPDRLRVIVEVPEALKSARVPVLILQPIVENAIKYGVARSRGAVTVRITAYEEAGRLHLKVKDNGTSPPRVVEIDASCGVGLNNVRERLIARYAGEAACFHGPDPEGGYTAHIIMPVIRDD